MAQRSPNTLSPARRFSIRVGLATGATITALLGAQTLAFMDQSTFAAAETTAPITTTADAAANAFVPTYTLAPTDQPSVQSTTLPPAAPQLTVMRNTANTQSQASAAQPTVQATATAVPATVIAQATPTAQTIVPPAIQSASKQVRPRTRSSR